MNYPKKIAMAVIGLIGFSIGTFLVIHANIGISPWDVLVMGIRARTGMLYGTVTILIGAGIMVVDLLLGEKLGFGTIVDVAIVGKTVDLLQWLDFVPPPENFAIAMTMLFCGIAILGSSIALYMKAGLGCGPRDALMLVLGKRLKRVSVGVARNAMDLSALLLGWLLGGGPVGIGTVAMVLLLGPTISLSCKLLRFDSTTVRHESLLETFSNMKKALNKQRD